MRRHAWTSALLLVVACDGQGEVDGGEVDGGADAGTMATCVGAAAGTPCGDGSICVDGACVASECGDEIVDDRTEDCDDGNEVAFDGCEPNCMVSCTSDQMCDDFQPCNGDETCGDSGCVAGTPLADGTACGESLVCNGEVCSPTRCGDGIIDAVAGEDCEDGNDADGDGCDGDCTFTCEVDADCPDDADECSGVAMCDTSTHTCGSSAPPAMGSDCTASTGGPGTCQAMVCVPAGCGNGIVDDGEDCDDMNADEADGCKSTCEFTCVGDEQCDDGNACNGAETCIVESNTCMAGTALSCNDGIACTADSCNASTGCVNTLIDADGDGEAARSLGSCGTDCDDTRATTCRGCSEICNNTRDDDCNGTVDDGLTTWFADCDGDGYAPTGAVNTMSCTRPSPTATGCSASTRQWITQSPAANPDCNDGVATVYPGAPEVVGNERDDNCDTGEICYRNTDGDSHRTTSTITSNDIDCDDAGEAASSVPSGDCCDSDSRVRPGTTTYYTSANGSSACGGWDFNCDGVTTLQYTGRQNTGCNWDGDSCNLSSSLDGWHGTTLPGVCTGAPGSSSPACGTPPYCWVDNCHGGFPSCSYDFLSRRQGCR
jgi:cysteine-rich repeat protein